MKYFIDTEFIEGFKKPFLGKRRHFIDLISIGIVSEDGRTYYAISNEFNPNDADQWVKDNVLYPIMRHNGYDKPLSNLHGCLSYSKTAVKNIQKNIGKSIKQISDEIIDFCKYGTWNNVTTNGITVNTGQLIIRTEPEFYGYYSDYDWVLFCSLFGRMKDIPKGFPMYCKDLKQMLDDKVEKLNWQYGRDIWSSLRSIDTIGKGATQEKDRPATFVEKLKTIKELKEYPKQENEYNALDDAKWNYDLYKFLQTI